MILEIPRAPVSPNDLLGYHWRYRMKNTALWRQEIHYALHAQRYNGLPLPKAKISIERRGKGTLDPDNLVGSVKPILDALRYAQVIEDDTPAHIQLTVTQVCSRSLPARTRIEITPDWETA